MSHKAVFDRGRKFGIELEFYGITPFELYYKLAEWGVIAKIELQENHHIGCWVIDTDPSIRGEDGIELRSPVLCGVEGLAEIRRVLTVLNHMDCQVNDSCGLHVHHYIEDFSGKDVLSLLRLYARFEPVIDGLVDVSRRGDNNIYCRSLLREENIAWIGELDRDGEARAVEVVLKYNRVFHTRMDKVNLLSYLKFGTLEFRQHEATLDPDEVVAWVVLTQLLVNRVKLAKVGRELHSSPVLSELERTLGLLDYQRCDDPLAIQCREWLKEKYSTVRKRKKELNLA